MATIEDDDYLIKLDANIEVETIVRNRFEDEDDPFCDTYGNNQSTSSDEEQTSIESAHSPQSAMTVSCKDPDNTASSDVSDTFPSVVSDISGDSGTSTPVDAQMEETPVEESASSTKDSPSSYQDSPMKDVNCKELIVFCIDMSSDMERVPFVITDEFDEKEVKFSNPRGKGCPFMRNSGDGDGDGESSKNVKQIKHTPLSMIKRAIGMFVHNKHFIDKKHEYSLMVLYDTAAWVCEFTKSPQKLISILDDLTETLDCDSCDLSSVVTLIASKFPRFLSTDFLSPDIHSILRVILIYGRNSCEIDFSDPNDKAILTKYPSIFLDILYIHEPPSDDNKCVEIFDALCGLDSQNKSYIFEVTRSVTKLHNSMGKFLSHPFQRPPQKNANYKLQDIVPE